MNNKSFWVTISSRGFSNEDNLIKLIKYNPVGIRINTGRDTYEWAANAISSLVKNSYPAEKIFLDVGNNKPRIRINSKTEELFVKKDDTFSISNEATSDTRVTSSTFFKKIKVNDIIVFGDGQFEAVVVNIDNDTFFLKSLSSGNINDRMALSIKNNNFSFFYIGEEEADDVKKILNSHKINLIISFVEDVENIKSCQTRFSNAAMIVPKIETLLAVNNIDEILSYSKLVLLGRGDLALSVGIEKIGLIQKRILKIAKKHSADVIIGTGTLMSLNYSAIPFRNEIIDITNSYLNGASGIMLTSETGASKTPFKFIDCLLSILDYLHKAEQSNEYDAFNDDNLHVK